MLKKVLFGSPVKRDFEILKLFLESVASLKRDNIRLDFLFYDDNHDIKSSELLNNFKLNNSNTIIREGTTENNYYCNENTHFWNEKIIDKVAGFKNEIINYCLDKDYDYLFLVDSDLILHPNTIEHLIETNKDIVSEVYWTRWSDKNHTEEPQVWLTDDYCSTDSKLIHLVNNQERIDNGINFMKMLKKNGTYKVGGLGACTLIKKEVLKKEVNFTRIENLIFIGEDRHFCIKAIINGFELFADTYYPPLHIYRDIDKNRVRHFKQLWEEEYWIRLERNIEGLSEYKNYLIQRYLEKIPDALIISEFINNKNIIRENLNNDYLNALTYIKTRNQTISTCIVTKNNDKYLETCIKSVLEISDELIFADLGSTDRTLEMIQTLNNVKILNLDQEEDISKIKNKCIETATGDWILFIEPHEALSEITVKNFKSYFELKTYTKTPEVINFLILDPENPEFKKLSPSLIKNNCGIKYKYPILPTLYSENGDILYQNTDFFTKILLLKGNTNREKENRDKYIFELINKNLENSNMYEKIYFYFHKANLHTKFKEYNDSIKLYKLALNLIDNLELNNYKYEKNTLKGNIIVLLILCLFQEENFTESIDYINNLLHKNINYVDGLFFLGYYFQKLEEYDKAIECYNKSFYLLDRKIHQNTDNLITLEVSLLPRIMFEKSKCLLYKGQVEEGINTLIRVSSITKSLPISLVYIEKQFLLMEKLPESVMYCRKNNSNNFFTLTEQNEFYYGINLVKESPNYNILLLKLLNSISKINEWTKKENNQIQNKISDLQSRLKNHKVSFVVITKNNQSNLEKTLQSILDLSFEIIILDIGSKDSTLEIAYRYGSVYKTSNYLLDKNYHEEKYRQEAENYIIGDWIFFIKPGEIIQASYYDNLNNLFNNLDKSNIYGFDILNKERNVLEKNRKSLYYVDNNTVKENISINNIEILKFD